MHRTSIWQSSYNYSNPVIPHFPVHCLIIDLMILCVGCLVFYPVFYQLKILCNSVSGKCTSKDFQLHGYILPHIDKFRAFEKLLLLNLSGWFVTICRVPDHTNRFTHGEQIVYNLSCVPIQWLWYYCCNYLEVP